jgi:hypothetical protein
MLRQGQLGVTGTKQAIGWVDGMRLSNARTRESDDLVDLTLADGRITDIVPATGGTPADGEDGLNLAGRLVLPGFVETHLHLDKAHLDSLEPNPDGTLAGAIAVTGRLKADFDHDGMAERARRVLDAAIAHGTTLIRAHPDVDPIVGTLGVEVLAELRREYAGRIDLQIVAFPQEGIEKAPGTLDLMRHAIELGADVVGGCTYNEPDLAACERHVLAAFDLAAEHDLPLDLHADFADDVSDERYAMASFIARTTLERGYEGRVALGHMTSLGSLAGTTGRCSSRSSLPPALPSYCSPTRTCTWAGVRTRPTYVAAWRRSEPSGTRTSRPASRATTCATRSRPTGTQTCSRPDSSWRRPPTSGAPTTSAAWSGWRPRTRRPSPASRRRTDSASAPPPTSSSSTRPTR